MGATERAERAFKELVAEGRQILSAAGWNGSEYQRHPPENDYFRFRTSAINLVRRVCGDDSEHYRELKRLAESKETANVPYYMAHLFGVVEAAERDFREGLVFGMRAL